MIQPNDLWIEALNQHTAALDQSEAARRFAVAALYYAIFHVAGRSLSFDTGASNSNHEAFFQLLKAQNRKAAERFQNLRVLRVRAHYSLGRTVTRQDLQLAFSNANAVRKLMDLANPDEPDRA